MPDFDTHLAELVTCRRNFVRNIEFHPLQFSVQAATPSRVLVNILPEMKVPETELGTLRKATDLSLPFLSRLKLLVIVYPDWQDL